MIKLEDVKLAYIDTFDHRNGNEFLQATDWLNASFYTLEHLDSNFKTTLVHSDGGIKDYLLIYSVGELDVLAVHCFGYEPPFDDMESFVDWLNKLEQEILLNIGQLCIKTNLSQQTILDAFKNQHN